MEGKGLHQISQGEKALRHWLQLHAIRGNEKCDQEIPQRIILICSTAHSDSNRVFKSLKNLNWDDDVIEEYNDSLLQDKMEELKSDLDHAKEYKLYKSVYKKFKECKDIDELNDDEMRLLYKFDFVKFQDLEKPKYPDGFITHYIIDDMIGTNIFKNGRSLCMMM